MVTPPASSRAGRDPIRVLIVDDHEVVRHGLASIIEADPGFLLVGQAPNVATALALVASATPNVCIVDLRLPDGSGVDFISRARAGQPDLRFVVLTTFDSDQDIVQAFRAGANAYLLKDSFASEIAAAIRSVADGRAVIPNEIAQRLRFLEDQRPLSPREREVLTMVARGESNRDIAAALAISEATVKTYLLRIFEKLDASDRASAVATAISRGIIEG